MFFLFLKKDFMHKQILKRDLKQMLIDNTYNILICIYELFYNVSL